MRTKAIIGFIIFFIVLMSPFIVNAAGQDMFHGANQPALSAVHVQYGAIMPPLELMQTHMFNISSINKQYGGTQNCLKCHSKANFCDQCHDYVGIRPSIGSS